LLLAKKAIHFERTRERVYILNTAPDHSHVMSKQQILKKHEVVIKTLSQVTILLPFLFRLLFFLTSFAKLGAGKKSRQQTRRFLHALAVLKGLVGSLA
jgi:hypothetical protein